MQRNIEPWKCWKTFVNVEYIGILNWGLKLDLYSNLFLFFYSFLKFSEVLFFLKI